MIRRHLLFSLMAGSGWAQAGGPLATSSPLVFPLDFGAHPETRTEWWYVTGQLESPQESRGFRSAAATQNAKEGPGPSRGFQVTFFRSAPGVVPRTHPSRFAAHHLIFAHAAVTDLKSRRLRHDQRLARAGFGIASAAEGDTAVVLKDWSLRRDGPPGASRYFARVGSPTAGFDLDLLLSTTQPVLLQGQGGLSRKGPDPAQHSHYYSQPQLKVEGRLKLDGRAVEVKGRAWLDHEWSQSLLAPEAVGWDWIGMNLDDGSALTAFRLRRADGSALYAGGSFRSAAGVLQDFSGGRIHFEPGRRWRSPASQAEYPVAWRVETPAGNFEVHACMDAQELDSRASTGAFYWEGLSELRRAGQARSVGRGYLEMTGYATRLVL